MTSASDEKWRPFNCFSSRVGLRTYQHLCRRTWEVSGLNLEGIMDYTGLRKRFSSVSPTQVPGIKTGSDHLLLKFYRLTTHHHHHPIREVTVWISTELLILLASEIDFFQSLQKKFWDYTLKLAINDCLHLLIHSKIVNIHTSFDTT